MTSTTDGRKRKGTLAREKRLKFKARLRREYQKLVDSGMDPFVAKRVMMKRRRRTASFLTMEQLKDILYR